MTYEKQDITDSFYSGNTKTIRVAVYEPDETEPSGRKLKDLTGCEITYVMTDRVNYDIVHLRKRSYKGESEIKIVSLGICDVYILASDTPNLYGKFRHHVNVVDTDGHEETVLTGFVEIHKTSAKRFREAGQMAYLEGSTT